MTPERGYLWNNRSVTRIPEDPAKYQEWLMQRYYWPLGIRLDREVLRSSVRHVRCEEEESFSPLIAGDNDCNSVAIIGAPTRDAGGVKRTVDPASEQAQEIVADWIAKEVRSKSSIVKKFQASPGRIPSDVLVVLESQSRSEGLEFRRRFRDYLWLSVKRHAYRWLKKEKRLRSIEDWPSPPDDNAEVMLRVSILEAALENSKFPQEVVKSTLCWWNQELNTESQASRESCLLRWETWWNRSGEAQKLSHDEQDEFWVAVVLSMSLESHLSVNPVSLASELANEFVEIVLAAKDRLVGYHPYDDSRNRVTTCNGWELFLARSLVPLVSGCPVPSHQDIVDRYFSVSGKRLLDPQKKSRHIFQHVRKILEEVATASFTEMKHELHALTEVLALQEQTPLDTTGSTAIERSLVPLQISDSHQVAGTPFAELTNRLADVIRSVTEVPRSADLRMAWEDLMFRPLDKASWSTPPTEILTGGSSRELIALKETAKHWIQRDDSETFAEAWQVLYHDTIATHLIRFASLISSQNTETLQVIWTELASCEWIDDVARSRFVQAAERISK